MAVLIPPPVYAVAAAAAQHLLAGDRRPGPVRVVAAGALAAASAGLIGGSAREFRSARTTVHPLHPEHASTLVTDGPNRLTRNPMYVGLAGLLTAHAVLRGGWTTVLPVGAFVAAIDRLQIRVEERALRESFGADYTAYCARVPRWLGRPSDQPGNQVGGSSPGRYHGRWNQPRSMA